MSTFEETALHDALIHAGVVAPVAPDGPDEQTWHDCDLASLAENWLGDRCDPRELSAERRADWRARATTERLWPLRERTPYQRCYWLLDDDRRTMGTLALATSALGGKRVELSSLYILPTYRSQGAGRRAMQKIMAVARESERGLRLDTYWCWGRAVRFYLNLGFWVYMWKRELTLCWDAGLPPPHIDEADDELRLSVPMNGASVALGEARRREGRLEWLIPPLGGELAKKIGEAAWLASSTLALTAALRGFPLVRSAEDWQELHYCDAGPPEALAYKITIWEAYARSRRYRVDAPRIPGLDYPTWDELNARWDAERKAFEAKYASVTKPPADENDT